jgi:hypothetical protein
MAPVPVGIRMTTAASSSASRSSGSPGWLTVSFGWIVSARVWIGTTAKSCEKALGASPPVVAKDPRGTC